MAKIDSHHHSKKTIDRVLSIFAVVAPLLALLSASRSLEYGWHWNYSLHLFAALSIVFVYLIKDRVSIYVPVLTIVVITGLIGVVKAFEDQNALSAGLFFMLSALYIFAIFNQKISFIYLAFLGLLTGSLQYFLSGQTINALFYVVLIPGLGYFPMLMIKEYVDATTKLNQDLEKRIRTSTEQSQHKRFIEHDYREKIQDQQQLIGIISQEIRNPATAIQALMQTHKIYKNVPYGNELQDNVTRILSILDEFHILIDADKAIETADKRISPYDVVHNSLKIIRHLLADKDIDLHFDSNEMAKKVCKFNPHIFQHILLFLTKNVLTHKNSSNVWITLCGQHVGTEYLNVKLTIKDDGLPIVLKELDDKKLDADYLFKLALAELKRNNLELCNDFLEQLHANIAYEPLADGSNNLSLSFDLKFAQLTTLELDTQSNRKNSILHGLRILVVEDVDIIREITSEALSARGAKVKQAADGLEALAIVGTYEFDVVLTDLILPEMNGYELTRSLRVLEFNKPIIGLTAASIGREAKRFIEEGGNAILEKPIKIESIIDILNEYIKH